MYVANEALIDIDESQDSGTPVTIFTTKGHPIVDQYMT